MVVVTTKHENEVGYEKNILETIIHKKIDYFHFSLRFKYSL